MYKIDFSNKHILIYDASFDLGPLYTEAFLEHNGTVSALSSNSEVLDNLKSNKNLDLYKISDIKSETIQGTIQSIVEKRGNIDVFIFNDKTGTHPNIPIEEYSNDDWLNTYEHNINTAFYFIKAVAPIMKKAKEGSILFISTTSSFISIQRKYFKVSPAYESANASLNRFAKHLALDLGGYGINVNTLCPGNVDKPGIHGLVKKISDENNITTDEALEILLEGQAIKKLVPKEDVVCQALNICSDFSKYITGQDIIVSGGLGL